MKNKYGNYVILKLLSTADHDEKRVLAQSLLKNVNSINVLKYKNYWIQFLEENPLKIPGLTAQTIKPSLFKPVGLTDSGWNSSTSDINSPKTTDEWSQSGQETSNKASKDGKEEKSQFYHERFKDNRNSMNIVWNTTQQDNNRNTNNSNQINWGFEVKNFRTNNSDIPSEKSNNYSKKHKNFNQKFYEKNQYYTNKNGYNNFS